MTSYLQVLPVEITQLPLLEKLYIDNNKLSTLPPELGELKNLKVLAADYNLLVSVPGKLESFRIREWKLDLERIHLLKLRL